MGRTDNRHIHNINVYSMLSFRCIECVHMGSSYAAFLIQNHRKCAHAPLRCAIEKFPGKICHWQNAYYIRFVSQISPITFSDTWLFGMHLQCKNHNFKGISIVTFSAAMLSFNPVLL